MDGDGWLAATALTSSLALYGLLAAVDGRMSASGEPGAAEHSRARRRPLLAAVGVRAVAQVAAIAVAAAAFVALAVTQNLDWRVAALSGAGLAALVALGRGIAYAIAHALGARWGGRGDAADALANGLTGLAADGGDDEELDPHERRMIRSILQLDQTTAREIMAPRMDFVAADVSSTPAEVADLMRESGHSRIPLYRDSLDDIVGIAHSRDMLRNFGAVEGETRLMDLARPALFVPESKRLDELLREFQENHIQIAIVVDEYGGTAGLVTIEDLLEEIVGEIEDEFDVDEPLHEMLDERRAVMDARMPLDEVNRVLSVNLEGDGFDTLGGLLYQRLGKMPSPGDELRVDGLDIRVISTLGRRIKKVEVSLEAPP